jgi:hypothetical protein
MQNLQKNKHMFSMLTSATKTNSKILTQSSTTFYTPTNIFDSSEQVFWQTCVCENPETTTTHELANAHSFWQLLMQKMYQKYACT